MAQRGKSKVSSIVNDTLVIEPPIPYNKPEQIRVRSQFSAHLIVTGQVTGKLYSWQNSGDVVEVDAQDVDDILSKKLGEGACCGAVRGGNVLFELA